VTADIDDILALGARLADAARAETLSRFRTGIGYDAKADVSPVTAADRASEKTMRAMIEAERPGDGIFGEEFGVTNPDAETVWILDPIDGTKAFITGKPVYGTLIGVVRNGKAIAGVMDGPATGDRWSGAVGHPTLFNGKPIETRKGPAMDAAWLTSTTPQMFKGEQATRFNALMSAAGYTTFGSECQGYGQLACGWVDLVCESDLAPYDYAALVPIVEGAGGVMTGWDGAPLSFASDGGKKYSVIAAATPELHQAAVEILSA